MKAVKTGALALSLNLLAGCGGGGGGREGSVPQSANTPNYAAPRLTVEGAPNAEVFLTWEQVAGADTYRINRRVSGATPAMIGEFSCPAGVALSQCAPRFQDTAIPTAAQGQDIYYSVQALANGSLIMQSPERRAATGAIWRAAQRGDVSGRGFTAETIAVPPTPAWTMSLDGPVVGVPAVSPESGVVVAATARADGRGTVYSVALTGPKQTTSTAPNTVADTSHIKWTRELPGQIVSSPAIADGVVFTGGRDNTVTALDLITGVTLWQYFTKDDVGSSPVIAYGRLFIGAGNPLAGTGNLDKSFYILDAFPDDNGDGLIDHMDLDEGVDDPDGVSFDLIARVDTGDAVAGTAAVLGGLVVFGGVDDHLYLVDAFTGQTRSIAIGSSIVATPALKRVSTCKGQPISGTGIFFGTRNRFLHYIDQGPGTTPLLCWQVAGLEGDVLSGAALAGGKVVFTIASPTTLSANKVHALDEATGQAAWAAPFESPDQLQIPNGPLVAGDRVWVSTGNPTTNDRTSRLLALSLASGQLLWQEQIGLPPTQPMLAGGLLVTGTLTGQIRTWR